MKQKVFLVSLITIFLFVNIGTSFATAPPKYSEAKLQTEIDEFIQEYKEKKATGNKALPSEEWLNETIGFYKQLQINPNAKIQPSKQWMEEMELQYQETMKKVDEQINSTKPERALGIKSATDVYTGTVYTFTIPNCGAKGKYGNCDENKGNFKNGWSTSNGGYADTLTEFTKIHYASATTWAWVGKEIKVHGTKKARIHFDGHYAYYILGDMIPTYARGKVKVVVFNATDGQEVATKEISSHTNIGMPPSIKDEDFNKYIDVNLEDGKTYYLKMQVDAYVGAGRHGMADLISSNDIPARGGDGVDYHYIKITWL